MPSTSTPVFFLRSRSAAADSGLANVQTILGKFTDPALPATNIDVALFHDVLHHVEDRQSYLKTLTRYLSPKGRVVVVDCEGGRGRMPANRTCRSRVNSWRRR